MATATTTRQRNEAVWKQSSALLYDKRLEEFLAYWHEDARYEVAYPVEGVPPVVEGHAALGELFAAFTAAQSGLRSMTSASTRPTTPRSPSSRSA
jgi:hypothetical protein